LVDYASRRVVRIEVDGIGSLQNRFVTEDA